MFRAYCGYIECTLGHFQSIVMPLGCLGGSLKGLEIAISLCDSEKHVIFLFFAILTMLWCFPGLGIADKSCSEHSVCTMGAH